MFQRFRIVPVAKSGDAEKKTRDGAVCGGDYVELFQRQTQVYLHRGPDGKAFCYNTTGDTVVDTDDVPATDLRADLLWQLNTPTMRWCGKVAAHSARNQVSFSLRDGISGDYLCEELDGGLTFQDSDEDASCHWHLVPFEDDMAEYITERSQFYLENVASGNRLSQGQLVAGSEEDEAYTGLKYDLVCADSTTVQEDDLFVFRFLPPKWVQEFFDTMQLIDVLKRYTNDMKGAVEAAKKDMSR